MGLTTGTFELRARLRGQALSARVRDCGRRPVSFEPGITVVQHGGKRDAFWTGMLSCGCQHSCPVCNERRAKERRAEVESMMRADPEGRWQMVTLTLRHHARQDLPGLLALLFATWRRVRATRAVREIMARRVRASVRALEVTFSWANGWHPHLHLLWGTTEWKPRERRILLREWARALDERKTVRHLIRWSTAFHGFDRNRAWYMAKLGCEIAGIGKEAHGPNLKPFQLAQLAADGIENAQRKWREYQWGMKGRRILEMDERAKALAAAGSEHEEPERTWKVAFYGEQIRDVAQLECIKPTILWDMLNAGNSATSPPEAIEAFLWQQLAILNARRARQAA